MEECAVQAAGSVPCAAPPLTFADPGAHVDATVGVALDATPVAASCRHEVILPVSGVGITTVLVSAESPTRRPPQPAVVWQTDSAVRQTILPLSGISQARSQRNADDW